MKRLAEFLKSILAGVMISMGGIVFLSCDNKYVGALLFSTGLLTVVMFGFNLYTGKVGYIFQNDKAFLLDTVLSIFGNLMGCIAVGLARPSVGNVVDICASKLDKTLLAAGIDAVFCGILIFVCVDIFKKTKNPLGIFFCIPTFILCGFEHSVADMFYFINARAVSLDAVIFIAVVVLGNAVGGLLIPVVMSAYKKLSGEPA